MKSRFTSVFLISFGILLFYLTPNVNTGDAGELITAAHFLGIAHPSGYPLYLMISKAFTLLPFGNMGFKVAIVSAVFSALSLALLYQLVFRLTTSDFAAFATAGFLLTSFSYLTQSVIAKFYTLNLFLVLALFAIWHLQLSSSNTYRSSTPDIMKRFHLTFFLFGLICANHNTGILIAAPVIYAIWILRKHISLSLNSGSKIQALVLTPLILFSLGFAVNIYLFVRGGDSQPFNVFHIKNLREFFNFISRQTYGEIGTLSKAGDFLSSPISFWYGLNNFVSILDRNFGSFSFLIFLSGCYFIFRKNIRLFFFAIIGLMFYGPFFTKIAIPTPEISAMDFYVYAHQYYLPAFAIYAFFLGPGLFQISIWMKIGSRAYGEKIFSIALLSLFALLLFFRTNDSNYRLNHAPYQTAKDTYSIMPVGSFYLARGDNEKYQGRYLKLIGRYREDICHINSVVLQNDTKGIRGCDEYNYSSISSALFADQLDLLKPIMAEGRFWSDSTDDAYPLISAKVKTSELSLSYIYFPEDHELMDNHDSENQVKSFIRLKMPIAEKLVNIDVCPVLSVEDMFTNYLCNKYVSHMTQLTNYYMSPAASISDNNHNSTDEK